MGFTPSTSNPWRVTSISIYTTCMHNRLMKRMRKRPEAPPTHCVHVSIFGELGRERVLLPTFSRLFFGIGNGKRIRWSVMKIICNSLVQLHWASAPPDILLWHYSSTEPLFSPSSLSLTSDWGASGYGSPDCTMLLSGGAGAPKSLAKHDLKGLLDHRPSFLV